MNESLAATDGPPGAATDPQRALLMRLAGGASVAVALLLIVIKSWAWLATGSVSLLGSLADSLLDLIASLITFFAVRVALEPPDREHRFGHGKSEAIAGLLQAVIVTVSALYVALQALLRLWSPTRIESAGLGIAVIVVSLVFTLALVLFQRFVVARTGSLAIAADAVHYRADMGTNLTVIAALVLNHYFGWYAADPLLGLVIVALILWSVRAIALEAVDVLLDRELDGDARQRIKEIATRHRDVLGIHDLRSRSSGRSQFIQLHLELDPAMSLKRAHAVCDEVELEIQAEFPSAEVMIHADPHGLAELRDPF